MEGVRITKQLLLEVAEKIRLPEQGGILGADGNGTVRYFHFDSGGTSLPNEYLPDTAALNKVLAEWYENNIRFVGLIHSHPTDKSTLSAADISYARQICRICGMDDVLMLLYLPENAVDDERFIGYVVSICGGIICKKVLDNGRIL